MLTKELTNVKLQEEEESSLHHDIHFGEAHKYPGDDHHTWIMFICKGILDP